MKDMHSEAMDRLFSVLLQLKSHEEYYAFFEDLCTIKELQDISQRLEVAVLLNEGKNYQEVSRMTNVSSATISRVKKCLEYGTGGYQTALERLAELEGKA